MNSNGWLCSFKFLYPPFFLAHIFNKMICHEWSKSMPQMGSKLSWNTGTRSSTT